MNALFSCVSKKQKKTNSDKVRYFEMSTSFCFSRLSANDALDNLQSFLLECLHNLCCGLCPFFFEHVEVIW